MKILYYLDGRDEALTKLDTLVELIKPLSPILEAVFVLDRNLALEISNQTREKLSKVLVDLEEKGWNQLYYVQEYLLDSGIPVSINLLEGTPLSTLLSRAKNFDLLVVVRSSGKEGLKYKVLQQIMESSPIPVLFL